MHSFGMLQCPCCSLQPGKHRAVKKEKKMFFISVNCKRKINIEMALLQNGVELKKNYEQDINTQYFILKWRIRV